jgi:hypothetical protein
MLFKYLCLSSSITKIINKLETHEPSKDNQIIITFQDDLYKTYKSYKLKKIYTLFLRFLQVGIGLGMTTLTTTNNPYFKDNTDMISIILWYISISNNLVNLLSENAKKYNIGDDKLKIKLLISESNKYMDNFNDYSIYAEDQESRILYFKKCYQEIMNKTPHEYLLYQGRRPSHATIEAKTRRLEIQKNAWGSVDEITDITEDTDV